MPKKSNRKFFFVFCLIMGFVFGYLINRFIEILVATHRVLDFKEFFEIIKNTPFHLSRNKYSIGGFLLCIFFAMMFFLYHYFDYKNYRNNEEHGSARWATQEDRKKIIVDKGNNNMILSATEQLSMDMKKTGMNNNVLVVGGPSRGKTYKLMLPNLMQAICSYVIVDPKGTTKTKTWKFFENEKYKVREFNTVFFEQSFHWNPFVYFKSEVSIMRFVTALIKNTKNPDERSNDPFWEKAEILLYCALISYIMDYCRLDDQNINSLIKLLDAITVREDNEDYVCTVDILFEEAEINNPESFCVKQYHKFKNAAGVVCFKRLLNHLGSRLKHIT